MTLNLVAFGECMIELRRHSADLMVQSFGGDTLNAAIYLARLAGGAYQVHYATALGDSDAYSEAMLASWHKEGIATDFVSRPSGQLPGLYAIDVDNHGERKFSYWRNDSAARKYFDAETSPLERNIGSIDAFYFSGISLAILPAPARLRLFAVLEKLQAAGKTIIFDNNYRPRLWSRAEANENYAKAYRLADIALVTLSDEMERENIADEAAMIDRVLAYPANELVIKRGSASTLLLDSTGQKFEIETQRVERVVDTTAAGDSFGAAYIATRLKGGLPVEAAKAGNRLAAQVIQYPGAIIPADKMPA